MIFWGKYTFWKKKIKKNEKIYKFLGFWYFFKKLKKKIQKIKNNKMFHPVFEINKERFIPLEKVDFLMTFNKKNLYEISQPKNIDYINDSFLYFFLIFHFW